MTLVNRGFQRTSKYADLLEIETCVQEVRGKAAGFRFEFYPETCRDLLAKGAPTLVAIGPECKVRELPERVKAALSLEA